MTQNKLALGNSTERSIGKAPSSISGHIHGVAVGINSFSNKSMCCTGCEIIIVRLDCYAFKDTGGSNVGSNEDTVCGRTLCTVTRNGTHCKIVFANTLGNKRGGAAAVTVSCPFTTESEHGLTKLVGAKTNGVVCCTAVVHTNNEGTVFFNTNHRACCGSAGTFFCFSNEFAVFNGHTERYAYCVKKGAVCEIAVKFSLIESPNVAGNLAFCILKYVEDGGSGVQYSTAGSYVFSEVTDALAVVNENTGRIGVVVKVRVHTANDVVAQVILVILSHLGKFLMRPILLFSEVLIDLIITGNDRHVRVGGINLDYVHYLSAVVGGIVNNNFTLDSRTGNEIPFFACKNGVVSVGTEGSANGKIHSCFCNGFNFCCIFCKNRNGRENHNHQNAEESCQKLGNSFFLHSFLLLVFYK